MYRPSIHSRNFRNFSIAFNFSISSEVEKLKNQYSTRIKDRIISLSGCSIFIVQILQFISVFKSSSKFQIFTSVTMHDSNVDAIQQTDTKVPFYPISIGNAQKKKIKWRACSGSVSFFRQSTSVTDTLIINNVKNKITRTIYDGKK